ncbi:MAG: SMP-30/gluconolactonase/LRE family protein [Woeseia sp.]|nr:SMP-30/gluconolactonase/LRE family protein [Woeseia sp.]MBT8096993.1 SMP-30/gluconolactonase/LRE family protein [Woeseia sp.]NNE59709.1 SMP-30/gluconolactonase/LRE family protein [Woeseia sp.]NNL54582.1 SMP-30/gluconolactonase/LRE family protein [Woeseia sp.]
MQPSHAISVNNLLGESVTWREHDQSLWWTDVQGKQLYRLQYPAMDLTNYEVPERLASFGFVHGDRKKLICAFESGFAFFWPTSGDIEWIRRHLIDLPGVRLNDGRVDRQGRFWAGSMVEDGKQAGAPDAGMLYRIDQDLTITPMETGLHISNGLAWSLASTTLYFCDSPLREIRAYEFDPESGETTNRQSFYQFEEGAYPDGATVDAAGNLWSAIWSAGRVECIDQCGARVGTIDLPVTQPTCVCFGGPDLTTLFVTTAKIQLSEDQLTDQPLAGALLIYEKAGKGVPENAFGSNK